MEQEIQKGDRVKFIKYQKTTKMMYGTLIGVVTEVHPHDPKDPISNHGCIVIAMETFGEDHVSHYGWQDIIEKI